MKSRYSSSNEDVLELAVKVKLVGALKKLAERSEIRLENGRRTLTVTEVVSKLCHKVTRTEFERAIVDPVSRAIGPHIIVLVNDREIGVLQGLETRVKGNDVVTLIPVAHGG
jgi:molybdopterin converting factor small subunit